MTLPKPHHSPALSEVKEKVAGGALAEARNDLEVLLKQSPNDIEALYLYAVVCRYLGDSQASLQTLAHLKSLSPAHSRAHQEEGHVLRSMGNTENALAAYHRAIQLNPALRASLRESLKILRKQGRDREAVRVQIQLEQLEALPKPLAAAIDLVAQNKLLKAEAICRSFLQQHPKHVEAMRLLADIGVKLGVLDDAEFLLENARVFEPDNIQVHMDYVQVLRKRQKFAAALEQAEQLLAKNPQHPQFKSLSAIEHMQTGDYETALSLLDEVLEQIPNDPRTLTTQGHALKTCGRSEDAVAAYRRAVTYHPEHGEAFYSLANLKTYLFADEEIAQMEAQLSNSNLGFMDRVHLNFALAKAYEDRNMYAEAFAFYEHGNQLKKNQSRYDADRMHEEFAQTKALCTADFFAARADFGNPSVDPIFVLGLPRAGSTLLEQILSSHSQVDGTLELPNILSLSQQLRRRKEDGGYPAVLQHLTPQECETFGHNYLEETQIHRVGAPFFVDKMPNNFRHIGLIKLILPNAKIIDARRDPMACCFSGYKQLFAEGQEFSYSLADIGRYYKDYVDLMAHWDRVLPSYVLRVSHEDVVADLEGQVRRILDFCQLPFEEACLRYYETERNVRTPSSEQVRQPIFKDGVEQWKNFEPWLAPLKDALGDLAENQ